MFSVVVIFAPTACGKTALAKEIFGRSSPFSFKGEVVSADSQAVYRGLDIGTAKPSAEDTAEIPHHLIDVREPFEQFSLGDFMDSADALCGEIHSRGRVPVVVGGTGFYVRNFLAGGPSAPECPPEVRSMIRRRLSESGRDALFAELEVVDESSARRIGRNDEYRICRALEVFYSSGRPLSSYSVPSGLRGEFRFCPIILSREREDLYRRIDERVELMFRSGLPEEVAALRASGCSRDTPAMKAIGYSEFFIEGLSLDEVKEMIKIHSRRYARKQYALMRGIPGAVEVGADDRNMAARVISEFLS